MTHELRSEAHASTVLHSMESDHQVLESKLQDLVMQAHDGDAESVRAAFMRFDAELRGHLEAEEQRLLPHFKGEYATESAGILAEHQRIRQQVDQLGIALELHTLRATMVDEFAKSLHAHADRESKRMYRWSDDHLPPREKHAFLGWVLGRLEEYVATRKSTPRSGF